MGDGEGERSEKGGGRREREACEGKRKNERGRIRRKGHRKIKKKGIGRVG